MRSPLQILLSFRMIGTYLRFRVVLLGAWILAVVGGAIALEIGGVVGMMVLLGLVFVALTATGIVLTIR